RLDLAEVGNPTVTNRLVQQLTQVRVTFVQPATRRHTVGQVDDPVRVNRVQVLEHGLLHQLRVQSGYAVHRVAANESKVAHADRTTVVVVDRRQVVHVDVRRDHFRRRHELPVDKVDQLQVPRQDSLEELQRPSFQRLGKQRVVG